MKRILTDLSRVKSREHSRGGFSLIELLIVISLVSVLVAVLSWIVYISQRTFNWEKSYTILQSETRLSLDTIKDNAREANSILSSYTNPDNVTYTASSSTLIIKLPSIDSNQSTISGAYDYLIFLLNPINNQELTEKIYADSQSSRDNITKTLANHISSFGITYYNSLGTAITTGYENTTNINIQINSEESVNEKTNQFSLSSQSKIRNK